MYEVFYSKFVENHFSVADYWKDPHHIDLYLEVRKEKKRRKRKERKEREEEGRGKGEEEEGRGTREVRRGRARLMFRFQGE